MFTLTQNIDANTIVAGGSFYYFAQVVYVSLIISVLFTIFNFIVNMVFFSKNKGVLQNVKHVRKIKILNLISLVLFPLSIAGLIVMISFL